MGFTITAGVGAGGRCIGGLKSTAKDSMFEIKYIFPKNCNLISLR